MTTNNALSILKDQLIVSCQPVIGGALDKPEIVAALALAALDGGAAGLRIEGVANLRAVRAVTTAPIIGLLKRDLLDSDVRITPWLEDVRALIAAGADIIAFDATNRSRPVSIKDIVTEIKQSNCLAMADCSTLDDGKSAADLGVEILGTTMSGYTGGEEQTEPDFELVSAFAELGCFVIAEGRYHAPQQAKEAITKGADAVVVGSAITRPEHITSWFSQAITNGVNSKS